MYENEIALANVVRDALLHDNPQIHVEISFSDDFIKDALSLPISDFQKNGLTDPSPGDVEKAKEINAAYFFPNRAEEVNYILVSPKQIDGYLFVSSVAHEVQHAIDYWTMCNGRCQGDFNLLMQTSEIDLFVLWSEFHAHRTAHRVFITATMIKIMGWTVEQVKKIMVYEQAPQRIEMLMAMRNEGNVEGMVRDLAKFAAWEDLYQFGTSLVPEVLRELYDVMKKHEDPLLVEWEEIERVVSVF